MGYSGSWVAITGRARDEVLARRDLVDTGRPDEGAAYLACADLPGGWVLLRASDMDFAEPDELAALSEGAVAFGCQVEEHVMYSAARLWEDGREVWAAVHDPDEDPDDVAVSGSPPPEFAAIRARLAAEQEGAEGVDYMFDAAVELSALVCGYRHDQGDYDFTVLERAGRSPKRAEPAATPARRSWLSRLFGG